MLLVDIGNSRLKWTLFEAGVIADVQAFEHRSRGVVAGLDAHWRGCAPPARMLVANVAGPGVEAALRGWVGRHWPECRIEFVATRAHGFGVTCAYAEPSRLGVDRWVSLVGAHLCYGGACLVVDCGSAVTVDVVDESGRHLGGAIMPGLGAMRASLSTGTHAIDDEAVVAPPLLGTSTRAGISAGIHLSVAGLVDRVIDGLPASIGPDLRCLLSGGDGPKVQPLLSTKFEYVPNLVLEGLAAIAEEN